ncbi:TRAP-type C4-dicarboxylate transport system substrate-binding protein [Kushneria sinocarnis]|uniref:TRAP-type C4-dicarboxylate transport system substrate-binding protein n=1 Tax=Kushneria sinocarnis TaxID=595502 RepID=A0A420WW94_9GAMM|nr:TRAP transporter substrate-binding protein [Kushneria sinocarnis]RKR03409.1 TRAP-type C4-dicarboxylate transport system substrate-binding protein [Kushneria sinocarnis]
MRVRWLHTALLSGVLALGMLPMSADAATTLRLAHFWPAGSAINQQVFRVWADAIEQASDGELEVQIFPSETLAGADHAYRATVDGIADITATAQGYTAGRFPLTQIIELPGVSSDAEQGSCIAQTLFSENRALAREYRDSHVLFLFTTGPGFINTRARPVRAPDDLAGLRIRRPTVVVGELLESLGAQPVGMPAPATYTAMQRGVIDGVTLPWEGMKTFRLNELAHQHTVMPLYTLTFVATMNRQTYQRLPAHLQQVIDDHSGMQWARRAGRVFQAQDTAGRQQVQGDDHHVIEIQHPLDDPRWGPPLHGAINGYLQQLEQQGLPARKLYRQAREAARECSGGHA